MKSPFLSPGERERLEQNIRRILVENGCPADKAAIVAFECSEEIGQDAVIAERFNELVERGESN